MKFIKVFFSVFAVIGLASCSVTQDGLSWTSLSGSFDGWHQIGDANWRIEDGVFVADAGNGHLVSDADYDDFRIRLEFWVDEPANSGVFLRASNPESITQSNAYEVNIFDTRPDQTYRTGSIVEFISPSVSIITADRWNTYDITADGERLVVKLNGVTTAYIEDDTYSRGPISLQYGAGVVKFRHIEIVAL